MIGNSVYFNVSNLLKNKYYSNYIHNLDGRCFFFISITYLKETELKTFTNQFETNKCQ